MVEVFGELVYISLYTVVFALIHLAVNAFTHETTPAVACARGALLGLVVSMSLLYIARPIIKRINRDEKNPRAGD